YRLPMRSVAETAYRPMLTHRFVTALREWASLLEAARKPWPERATATGNLADRHRARAGSGRGLLPRALVQPFGYLPFEAVDPARVMADRGSRVAVAVERFRRDHSGALPKTLDELAPTYLAAVPLDPLSGRPLLYRQTREAYTIYSVGPDGRDDGGDLASELHEVIKRGWGRRVIKGRDVGVRILIH
ncbi:MAG: hypothetical protein ACRD15_23245, partial [Vicinamibacterales bacterium]